MSGRDRIDTTDGATQQRLARLEAVVEAQQHQLDVVRAENAELRRLVAPPPPTEVATAPAGDAPPPSADGAPVEPATGATDAPPTVGRRRMLTKGLAAGAAAAGAAATGAVLGATPAAAAYGTTVQIGHAHSGSSTLIDGETGPGLLLNGTPALMLAAPRTGASHLHLLKNTNKQPPVQDTRAHYTGELVVDRNGTLWYCGADGTPGTWVPVASGLAVSTFFPHSAPVRVYDSRPGTRPAAGSKTKLAAGSTRTISLRTNGASNEYGRAALVQVLLVGAAAGNGNFTIWSAGVGRPQANTMVWGGSAGRFCTLAFTNMDKSGNVQINASLATDVVIDVIGQYC